MGKVKYHPGDIVGDYGLILKEKIPHTRKGVFVCPFCKKEFETNITDVARGLTKSCGCSKGYLVSKNKLQDISGKRFGRLTAIEIAYRNPPKTYWRCKCDCGKETIVDINNLTMGTTKSCGCYAYESRHNYCRDLTGMKFGKLTVVKKSDKRDHAHHVYWDCLCDCGNMKTISGTHLLAGDIKSCGCILSYGEQLINKLLSDNNIVFIQQKMFDGCRNVGTNALLKFDFYLPNYNMCIEFDGKQHFFPTGKFADDFDNIVNRDRIKNKFCLEHGIKLIRIPYFDIEEISLENIFGDKYVVSSI